MLLGNKSQNSRKLSPPFSSRTSCFIRGGGSVVAAFIDKQYQRRPKQATAAHQE
jgi:hypothetical protein